MPDTNTQKLARMLADTPVFNMARKLWELNQRDWNLPLSKFDKLLVGLHLILSDYSQRHFPPTFTDQQKAYDAEISFKYSLPGYQVADVTADLMRKPFWFGKALKTYLAGFVELVQAFERLGVHPPQKLLELGCGTGWMTEFMALMRFEVLGTSISPHEIQDAQMRVESLAAKQLDVKLEFRTSPMESVDQTIPDQMPFDGVFVFEALHHAYDWRKAVQASYNCLKPGGWLIIANEPNALHTLISYRVAKLSNTHEIGFTRTELMRHLQHTGFQNITLLRSAWSYYLRPHWIASQK
jgi:2-polyprenyl-3-methyl-5-hydroxy-6-metoxy-1,4-benzoquinol methylase